MVKLKKHISSEEFLSLFRDKRFFKYCQNESIDYFAFKLIQEKSDSDSSASPNPSTFDRSKQLKKKSSRKTFVIFVDSLDRSVCQSPDLIQDLPHLSKLVDQSMLFTNYTSSGFWTFPCLHSIHHGVEPYLTGSFMRILPWKLFKRYREQKHFDSFADCYQVQASKTISPLSLTKFLRANKYKSVAIKMQRININKITIK